LSEIALQCMVLPDLICRLVRFGLVDPVEWYDDPKAWRFERSAVPLIQKALRLREDLEINDAGIGVIFELLDRIESLEKRIRDLERMLEKG